MPLNLYLQCSSIGEGPLPSIDSEMSVDEQEPPEEVWSKQVSVTDIHTRKPFLEKLKWIIGLHTNTINSVVHWSTQG